ncbi:MAG: quinone-dependent dihydroorotate dehydrogenase [Alphaproteobacteria bacterium]
MDSYRVIGPLVRLFPAEFSHNLTLAALRLGLVPAQPAGDDAILATRLWGRDFANPIGLAAGFDKNAEVIDAMLGLGFGFVEIGSVTPLAQPGNPKPRLFRLAEDEAVINRLGFNNDGMERVAVRLRRRRDGRPGMLGVNLGKNKDSTDAVGDYVAGARALAEYADYLVVNVSSPNTPGLRDLQDRGALEELLGAVRAARDETVSANAPPLLVKIAPDLEHDQLADIADLATSGLVEGIMVGNTTIDRPASLKSRHRGESGGLSGKPLLEPSTAVLRKLYGLTGGKVPLVGVGGVSSGADAYAKIRAGASLVGLYSALVYQGPGLVGRIKAELSQLLRADGLAHVVDAVGLDGTLY